MIDNKNAYSRSLWELLAEQTCNFRCKHVIQASTASSHRVGKCLFEPSKQSRIRRSSFWSHRRSTVQWETALSSKERSRRVNCPMIAPFCYGGFLSFGYTQQQLFVLLYKSKLFAYFLLSSSSFFCLVSHGLSDFLSFCYFSLRQWQAVTFEYA